MAWAALAVGVVGTVGKVILSAEQAKKAKAAEQQQAQLNQQYSQSAQPNLALAQQLFGGRMAGATGVERNIKENEQNTIENNQKGAQSGSQLLSANASAQGTGNQAFQNLGLSEAQNKYGLLNNLNLANQQQGNVTANQLALQTQQAFALRQSSLANLFGGINDFSSLAALGVKAGQPGNPNAGAPQGYQYGFSPS
jgi:hypothetical protein